MRTSRVVTSSDADVSTISACGLCPGYMEGGATYVMGVMGDDRED